MFSLFTRITAFLIMILFILLPVSAQDGAIRQWAGKATATSQYTAGNWSAQQATGAPDTRGCGDLGTAWASATVSDSEALTVYFDNPVYATEVNIHQTYTPGAITGIAFIPADEGNNIPVSNSADPGTPCPGVLNIRLQESTSVLVKGVVIFMDQTLVGDWNEIDAVELVGYASPDGAGTSDPSEFTPSSSGEVGGPSGLSVTCDDGRSFDNGIEVRVIQMRSGFTYSATAIGIDGFDPVLAVLDSSGRGLCTDDDFDASAYSAYLPTTGGIDPSPLSSQVRFANTSRQAFADISLVVGGFQNTTGEFLLILEGMALTSADGQGDPFALQITPGMIASDVELSAYMISVTNAFDPLIALIDQDYEFITDQSGNYIACDDAGYPDYCWGESFNLADHYVSRTEGRYLPGGSKDAMLKLSIEPGMEDGFFNFLMRSSGMNSYGDYIVAFHIGIGQP